MKCDVLQLLSVLTFFLSLVLMYVKAVCPHKPLDRAFDCTSHVVPDLSNKEQIPPKERIKMARDKCMSLKLHEVAICVEDILDNCRGTTDDEQTLHSLIDKDELLKNVQYFCKHIHVYERHAECIFKHHDETFSCSQSAHESFVIKERAGAKMDVLISGSCRFFESARQCLTNTTNHYCGKQAADFIDTLLSGGMPPYCKDVYYAKSTTSSYIKGGTEMTSLPSVFLISVAYAIVKFLFNSVSYV
ncbi:hypothetical protein ACF0H5_013838 [Mactra antiquata]